MNWQRSKRIAAVSLKWLNWTILLPFLLLCLLLALLLYTPMGLRLGLSVAQSLLPALTVERSDGSVLGGNVLHNLRWQQSGTDMQLQRVTLAIDNRCLLKLSLCVNALTVEGLSLSLTRTTATPDAAQSGPASLWLPFPISVSTFTVNNGVVAIDGQQLRWQHLSTALDAWGNKLQLTQPLWQQVELTLAASTGPATTTSPLQYTPPQLPDFELPLSLFVDQFRLVDFRLNQSGNQYQLTQLLLSLQWQGAQLNVTQLDLTHKLAALESTIGLNTTGQYPLTLDAQLQLTDGELAGQQLQLQARGDLAALQLDALAQGAVAAELELDINLLSPLLPHRLRLSSSAMQWPLVPQQDSVADISLSRSELTLQGDLQQSTVAGRLSLASPHVPQAAVAFSGDVSQHALTLDSLQVDTLGGQLQMPVTLNWQQGLNWHSETRLRNIQPGLFWPDYPGEINGVISHHGKIQEAGQWQLALEQLDINGTLRDYALQLTGSLQASDNSGGGQYQFSTPKLEFRHADNVLQLSGGLQQQWQLSVALDVPDLAQSVAQAKGALTGQFEVQGERLLPQVRGALDASKLRLAQWSLQQLNLQAALWRDSAQDWQTELELTASGGKYQQQRLTRLVATLTGTKLDHQFTLFTDAKDHQASVTLQGSLNNEIWQAVLQQADITSLLGQWQLEQATALTYTLPQQQLDIAAHCWTQQSSNLCATAPLIFSAGHTSATVKLTQFPLSAASRLLPDAATLSGSIDADLSINRQQHAPAAARLSISGSAGAMTQQLDTPLTLSWQSLTLQSRLADNNLHTDLQFNFSGQSELSATVTLGELDSDNKPLSGQIRLQQFAVDFLQPLLGEFSELSGMLAGDLRLSGTLQQPLLQGSAELTSSRVKGKLAPVDIDNADVAVQFDGQNASLTGLITTPRGEISLNGNADWQQLDNWQAELNIKGDELRLQVPQARLQIAPDLTLTANPQRTRISGTVQIPNAHINIDSLPQSAVGLSDDLVLLDKRLQPIPLTEKSVFTLETDITVKLGNRVRLSAFGLKTRLSGNLRVRQQPEQPLRVNGNVNLIDGTFRAYGQDLLIRKGKMNFNGPADQPYLNIEAIRNPDNMEDDVIAGIRVNGPADDPSVVVFSEPAKAQANALAYLLMGRDLDSESGNAGNAVTTSLIGMTLSSSSKVVGEIGEAFGLQDLTLDTAGAGDNSQVTVSGYLSRDLQLKYGYGIFNAVGEFTLRYRLMRRLYLEAVSGLDNAVDLLYKFEFD